MKNRALLILMVVALGVAFFCAAAHATPPENIAMESKVFGNHTKPTVQFGHKAHFEGHKIACADCHHRYEGGNNVWKDADPVQPCTECHTKDKAPKDVKLSEKEEIKQYYYSAIHENCKGCHAALKKANKPTGPVACDGCHVK